MFLFLPLAIKVAKEKGEDTIIFFNAKKIRSVGRKNTLI
jgi:hypothetical protein